MKKTMLTLSLLICATTLIFAQHDHAKKAEQKSEESMVMFKDAKIGSAYEHYIHLKDALVASNQEEAKKAAGQLEKSLKVVDGSKKMLDLTSVIQKVATIDDQRKSFSTLSNEMTTLVKGGKLSTGKLYLEFCPMANNNAGAFWLSNQKEIRNPYFGDMMLKCGSVKETIQ